MKKHLHWFTIFTDFDSVLTNIKSDKLVAYVLLSYAHRNRVTGYKKTPKKHLPDTEAHIF